MPSSRIKRKNRKHSGTFLAELPAVLYLLFIGVAVPMLILGSMFGRAFLLYSATQDACIQAARSRSFTEAKTTMTSVFILRSGQTSDRECFSGKNQPLAGWFYPDKPERISC